MLTGDSEIGMYSGRFPATNHSAVLALRSDDTGTRRCALETIIDGYWKPVYKYVRMRWRKDRETAEDLTQTFFLQVIEKEYLRNFDASKARFRTFVRVCLDRFVSRSERDAGRLKRGGGKTLSLDYELVESEMSAATESRVIDPQNYFDHEWVRDLLTSSVDSLRELCGAHDRMIAFRLFERYDLDSLESENRPTYAELATAFGLTVETVTNNLAYARRAFRLVVLERIRGLTASEEEYRQEVRSVLGVSRL